MGKHVNNYNTIFYFLTFLRLLLFFTMGRICNQIKTFSLLSRFLLFAFIIMGRICNHFFFQLFFYFLRIYFGGNKFCRRIYYFSFIYYQLLNPFYFLIYYGENKLLSRIQHLIFIYFPLRGDDETKQSTIFSMVLFLFTA